MTTRRDALKITALAATPLGVLAPAAAIAADDSRSALARLQDERAIETLQRNFLNRFNGKPGADCGEFVAGSAAIRLDADLCRIAPDPASPPRIELSDDGVSAGLVQKCQVERRTDFDGPSTLERMARFQGSGSASHSGPAELRARLRRVETGWIFAELTIA